MFKFKTVFFVTLFSSIIALATAATYEEFPLGCYSYLSNSISDHYTVAERAQILALIKDMGYNIAIVENRDSDNNLRPLLEMMYEDNGLYAILSDLHYPYPYPIDIPAENFNLYSTSALTTSSYLKLEAEYSGANDIDGGTIDANWYCSHDEHNGHMPRVGSMISDTEENPNIPIWKCTRGTTNPGFAYTDVRWRWPLCNESYKRLGNEFWIYNDHDSANDTYKFVYIRYRLKLANFIGNINATTPLLSFSTMGYRGTGTSDSTNVIHQFMDYNSNLLESHTTDYCYGDFVETGNQTGYYDIVIKISYASLIGSGLMHTAGWWKNSLINLNPRVFWHGNCDLYLDYIVIEDQMHYNMTHDATLYTSNINNRIDYLQSQGAMGMIKSIYSLDEPKLGQYDSYRTVQQYISETNPNIITAAYDTDYNKIMKATAGEDGYWYYDHVKSFRDSVEPKTILPNMYPITPGVAFNLIEYQTMIDDKVLRQYKNAKDYSKDDTAKAFVPIVQTFGQWNSNMSRWDSWVLPPYETQKCLKLLPLCYGADGVIDYRAVANLYIDPRNQQYCSIIKDSNGLNLSSNFTRDAVMAANRKTAIYGPLIKRDLKWIGAGCLNVDTGPSDMLSSAVLSNAGLSDAKVEHPGDGYYQGFIQCGLYEAKLDQAKNYFMLVNRRANYSNDDVSNTTTPPSSYAAHYISAEAQNALLVVNNLAHQRYGSYVALFDEYDSQVIIADNDTLSVILDPGDGKLLQMCSSLPSLVTSNATLKKTAYLSGVIVIDQGAEVTMMPNTVTRILPNSCIVVTGGSTLNLNGVVDIAAGVSILVEPGSSINFNETMCTWGIDSYLQVYEAQMNVEYASFAFNPMSELPYGIKLSNGSVATLAHVAISGSGGINVLDSDLYASDIDLVVPANRTGIGISNAPGSHEVHIDNTDSEGSISGIGDGLGRGIYGAPAAGLKLSNVLFANLNMGVELEQSNAVTDSIRGCDFENCVTGISLTGRRCMPKISVCSFVKDGLEAEATGVVIYGAYPTISECTFDELEVGVFAEFTSSTSGRENFMTGNTFYKCLKGIESRGSSYRVNNNVFTLNRTGINMVTGSNMNLGSNALNSLQNTREHLAFMFDQDFYACVQLYNGHNNFHHDPGPEYTEDALDFAFNDHFQIPVDDERFLIDVSGNWFEDGSVLVDPSSYAQYITYSSLDPYPNLMNSYAVLNRMDNALMLEAQGQYQQAVNLYKDILDEGLESEEQYLASAVDGVYRISGVINDPAWDASSYLDAKTVQYAEDIPGLSVLIDEYRVKCRIETGDFQSAINMVEGRISNPRSTVDSLLAVLDLEMVLLLQNSDETKQAVSTKYTQYKYPSMKAFKTKHHEHLEQLYELAGKAEAEIIIPPKPMISRNYPNPFNPSTTIAFSLPTAGKANLNIYNVKGQKVRDLGNPELTRGHHTVVWDGRDNRGQSVSSGVYFVRLSTAQGNSVRKILMLK